MVKLVPSDNRALLGTWLRNQSKPAIGTRSEVSQAGKKRRMPGLSDFYRVAMLRGDTSYRTRFPAQGLVPS